MTDKIIFHKPRSVLLEQLFLDHRHVLARLGEFLPFEPNLHIESESAWKGNASALVLSESPNDGVQKRRNDSNYASAAGELISLATLLGIIDLHYENVLPQRNRDGSDRPFPIDLETAFWDCVSAIDTNLIPSTITTPDKAGLNAGSTELYFPGHPQNLLDRFLLHSQKLLPHVGDILRTLEIALKDHPIRILLRPTRDYRYFLSCLREAGGLDRVDETNLYRKGFSITREELVQLEAGDIPYFFYHRSPTPELLYFSRPSEISRAPLGTFEAVFTAATRPIGHLADPKRLNRLCLISALHIFKAYAEHWPDNALTGEAFSISRSGNDFELVTPWFQARASLR